MRISRLITGLALLGVAVGLSPAISFDGTRAPAQAIRAKLTQLFPARTGAVPPALAASLTATA